MANVIQLFGGYTGFYSIADHVEYFGCEASGDPHFFDFFPVFNGNAHELVFFLKKVGLCSQILLFSSTVFG
jgi:hypothetical protein